MHWDVATSWQLYGICIGVRDEFVRGGGGGGWGLLQKYLSIALHENQVVLPEYYLIWLFEEFGGGGGAAVPLPLPHGPYAYGQYVLRLHGN